MPGFYPSVLGDADLSPQTIDTIAQRQGTSLIAVHGVDARDILAGKAQPPSDDEKFYYTFLIHAEDMDAATYIASDILREARDEQNKPVYSDLQIFLQQYSQASWKDQVKATLHYDNDSDEWDLLIFLPPDPSKNETKKILYRGSASNCCRILLNHFTGIRVKW